MPVELVAVGKVSDSCNQLLYWKVCHSISALTRLAFASSSLLLCEEVASLSLVLMQSTLIELGVSFSEKFAAAPSGRLLRKVALGGYGYK